jgi:hypothetical protein
VPYKQEWKPIHPTFTPNSRPDDEATSGNIGDSLEPHFSKSEPSAAPTFDTMNASNSTTSTSNDSHLAMNAYSEFAGDSNAWGQHSVDFSGVFGANGPPSWAWPAHFGQSPRFGLRNGPPTPPKESSPHTAMSAQSFAMDVDVDNPNEISNQKKRSAKRMAKSNEDREKGKPSRKPRKNSKTTRELQHIQGNEEEEEEGEEVEEEEGVEGEDKREKFLERNRVAASKCRQKKKAWTNNLEQRARELASERQMLTAHVAMLRNELLELKCRCLEHTSCNCEQIREYLKNTVAGLQHAPAALYQIQQDELRGSSSEMTSNGRLDSSPPYQASRQSSVSADSTLDYLKIEDDTPPTFNLKDPKFGGNGFKN